MSTNSKDYIVELCYFYSRYNHDHDESILQSVTNQFENHEIELENRIHESPNIQTKKRRIQSDLDNLIKGQSNTMGNMFRTFRNTPTQAVKKVEKRSPKKSRTLYASGNLNKFKSSEKLSIEQSVSKLQRASKL